MTLTSEKVWRDFSHRLRGFIARRVPSDAVDDLLGDVFVKVHARIDTLEDEARLAPWLFQITRNTLADHYRRFRPTTELNGIDRVEAEDDYDAAEMIAASLHGLVDNLPEKYREALTLTEFDGLTQAEMGERLGLSVSGAKSRVQRARGLLRDELLACCHFEFDQRGHVIDYEPRPRCCDSVEIGH